MTWKEQMRAIREELHDPERRPWAILEFLMGVVCMVFIILVIKAARGDLPPLPHLHP